MRGRKWTCWLVMVAVTTPTLVGCGDNQSVSDIFKFKGAPTQPTGEAPRKGEWPFRPVAMRVHPFTSLTIDESTGKTVLEARIELLDQVGDVAKGVGDFRFELYQREATASRTGQETQVQVWDAPMTTIEQNRQHWDSITRTYSFRLLVTRPTLRDKRYTLKVQFSDIAGNRLRAETEVPVSKSGGDAK